MDAAIRAAVEKTIETSQIPGIALAVARDEQPVEYLFVGGDATGRALDERSLFPVASVTKLATALAVLRLVEAQLLSLDEPLAHYLPEAVAAQPGVTPRKLLCHTSGLPADLDPAAAPYGSGLDWSALAQACLAAEAARGPDEYVEYSNAGYGLLAIAVERAAGQDFRVALRELVLEPLGIEAYLGDEPPRPPVVLTGVRGRHAGTAIEPYNSAFWRSLALPWAGLITTVDGALGLVRAFQGVPAGFLRPDLLADATRNQVGELGCKLFGLIRWEHCHWGLGVELRDNKTPHWAPETASPQSFGHSGQSGCVAWADPSAGITWACMGSRTADSGWLLRRASAIGGAILASLARP